MDFFRISCGFNGKDYQITIKKYENALFENNLIKYSDQKGAIHWIPIEELDVYHKGLIDSDNPTVSISTTKEDKVNEYVLLIRNMIILHLSRKIKQIEKQLALVRAL